MEPINRAIGRSLVGLTLCGLLAGAAFSLGYWQGQRVQLAAMQQWQQQNAARFAQVQQLAQAMALTTLVKPTTPIASAGTTQ